MSVGDAKYECLNFWCMETVYKCCWVMKHTHTCTLDFFQRPAYPLSPFFNKTFSEGIKTFLENLQVVAERGSVTECQLQHPRTTMFHNLQRRNLQAMRDNITSQGYRSDHLPFIQNRPKSGLSRLSHNGMTTQWEHNSVSFLFAKIVWHRISLQYTRSRTSCDLRCSQKVERFYSWPIYNRVHRSPTNCWSFP